MSELKFVEDGQEKTCKRKVDSDKTYWMTRFRAGVPTHSFHFISISQGELFLHKDILTEDGQKMGQAPVLYNSHREVSFQDKITLSPSHSKSEIVVFPLAEGIVVSSSGPELVVESRGRGEIMVVDYSLP